MSEEKNISDHLKILEEALREYGKRKNLSEFWIIGAYIGILEGLLLHASYKGGVEKDIIETLKTTATQYKNRE